LSTRASSDPPPVPAADRLAGLDGLRGVAIALVLWHHLVAPVLAPGRLNAATEQAWVGVDLFFALSGFLIGGILIDRRDSPRLMRVFYLRRAARILPLYYLALAAITGAVLAAMPGSRHVSPLWVHPLFLTNVAFAFSGVWDWGPLSVLWSLAVEEQFYLVAPWLVRACRPDRVGWLAVGLVAGAEVLRIGAEVLSPGPHLFIHVLTPFHMDALGCGLLVAWMVRTARAGRAAAFLTAHFGRFAIAGLVLLAVLNRLHSGEGALPTALWGYPVIGLGCGLLVLVAARGGPGLLPRLLNHPVLGHLGRRSYFIYLFHDLAWYALAALFGFAPGTRSLGMAGLALLTIALTWVAAEASWRWFEGPLVAWGHRQRY
jgi:peptidoglycan/LPS O-acetylase OafA/YrhL